MARLADSERNVWAMVGQVTELRVACQELQRVIAVLARRQAGVLVIAPEEMDALPDRTVLVRADRPDGAMVLRVESLGGQDEPGRGSEG